jgi:hypothetical protein
VRSKPRLGFVSPLAKGSCLSTNGALVDRPILNGPYLCCVCRSACRSKTAAMKIMTRGSASARSLHTRSLTNLRKSGANSCKTQYPMPARSDFEGSPYPVTGFIGQRCPSRCHWRPSRHGKIRLQQRPKITATSVVTTKCGEKAILKRPRLTW